MPGTGASAHPIVLRRAMANEQWNAVDRYITDVLVPGDPALDAAMASIQEARLPPISVSAPLGKLLHILALAVGARRVLEVGTLGGYSTIWLARALPPDGRLVTLELDPRHAEVATANIARAGLSDVVEIRLGRAIDTLPVLAEEGYGPFDLVFIDADKPSNADYFEWALRLGRVGTTIVVDNVVRNGKVADPDCDDADVEGVRRLNALIASEPRVVATAIQTVGSKGYDGFALAQVVAA
jgi:predicted O-methyltransferase YrrM